MKGLLLKDSYLVLKYCKAYLLMAICFIIGSLASSNLFFMFFPCIYTSMIPMTLYAYDEREKWTVFSETLPFNRKQLVSAKYIIGLILSVTVIILMSVIVIIKMSVTGDFSVKELLATIAVMIPTSILPSSFMMPFVFRYGSEKGRMFYYIIIGAFCALAFMSMSIINDKNVFSSEITPIALIGIVIASIIIYALSWMLSIAFYKKREI